ncbi:hypothetical protein [Nonomuraea sp. NPDC049784]|uniref:hypothetical protein n=1 Tax=Nonomuraea sp. NPDC049784 TaxID=3154361 RepID=UPI0033E3389F
MHGNPASDENMRLIGQVLPALAKQADLLAFRQGGNDSITYVFAPPDAAAAFEAQVRAVARRGGGSCRRCSCFATWRPKPPVRPSSS